MLGVSTSKICSTVTQRQIEIDRARKLYLDKGTERHKTKVETIDESTKRLR